MKKKHILIFLRSSWQFRECLTKDVISDLIRSNRVTIMFVDRRVSSTKESEFDLSEVGCDIIKIGKKNNLFFKIRAQISHFAYFLNQLWSLKEVYRLDELAKTTMVFDGPQYITLTKLLVNFKLAPLVVFILQKILKLTNPYKNALPTSDLCVIPYNPFSVFGISDDVIRECQRVRVPVFGVQTNLDNIVNRYPLEKPNFLSVIGETSFLHAVMTFKIPPYRIFPIGCLRYRFLSEDLPAAYEARRVLGLRSEDLVFLYAPSSRVHDESFVLRELDELCRRFNGYLDRKISIYYKGHIGKNVINLQSSSLAKCENLENVVFWNPEEQNQSQLEDLYKNIYGAIDGVISPFSSMVTEGNLTGLPALLLSYDPNRYGLQIKGTWQTLPYNIHNYPMRNSSNIICGSREDLADCFSRLVAIVRGSYESETYKKAAHRVCYLNEFMELDFVRSIEALAEGEYRDESFCFYRR